MAAQQGPPQSQPQALREVSGPDLGVSSGPGAQTVAEIGALRGRLLRASQISLAGPFWIQRDVKGSLLSTHLPITASLLPTSCPA